MLCNFVYCFQYAKDGLTKSNVPHGECVVCLETFEVDDNTQTDFIRTDCYHYFHYACLLQYVEHSQKQIDCQVEEARLRNEQLTSVEQVGNNCSENNGQVSS